MSAFKRSKLAVKISFRVTEEEDAMLKQRAADAGKDVVDVIREALDAYFTAGGVADRANSDRAGSPGRRRRT